MVTEAALLIFGTLDQFLNFLILKAGNLNILIEFNINSYKFTSDFVFLLKNIARIANAVQCHS